MIYQHTGKRPQLIYQDQNRRGDHICYYSDLRKFQAHYPDWRMRYSLTDIIAEMGDKMNQAEPP